ncbi:MAG: hypothetical protein LQ344_007912 [Seirophora lacunosa]|nr:MAG: hypothetical protein LQ344_007912 [Seirophora lacunosa]
MKEKTSSAVAAKVEASPPRRLTSPAPSTQISLQYPQPAAHSGTWPINPPPPPADETLCNLATNAIRPTRSSPRGTPISARSSPSSGTPHRSSRNPQHLSSFNNQTTDRPRSSRQDHYPALAPSPLHDPEKANDMRTRPPHGPYAAHAFATYIAEEEEDIEEHAVWILIYLSFFSPIVATAVSTYTLLTTLLLLLLTPVLCLCRPYASWKQRSHGLLTPPIRFQLRLVFPTPTSEQYGKGPQSCDGETNGNVLLLILLNIFSPIYAAGIAVTAWVAAGFWITAIILGNPDGRDGKDDGKAVVLGVRGLWEGWLRRALR